MTRFIAALLLFAALLAPRPVMANGMISYTQDSTRIRGYLALPYGDGTHPAVVLIHEWWGLNDWVKQQADSLALKGYVAFAVDLYHGQVANDQETAHQLMSGLIEDEAMTTLRASTDFLRARSDVRAPPRPIPAFEHA
jgi:carboxymethylenebutenolidase